MFEVIMLLGQVVHSGGFSLDVATGELLFGSPPETGAGMIPPAQEVLQNAGFETGSLSPWYTTASMWNITTVFQHSGTYCAADTNNYWIRQDFSAVPVESIISITIWSRQAPYRAGGYLQAFDLMYTDMSYYENVVFPTNNWQQWNITSWLTAGKSLNGLRIWGFWCSDTLLDSTYTDDVSIIANIPLEIGEGSPVFITTLSAWPSVFSSSCRIDLAIPGDQVGRLCLYSSSGALRDVLWSGTGAGRVDLDGAGLEPGVYILRLEKAGGGLSKTIVKK